MSGVETVEEKKTEQVVEINEKTAEPTTPTRIKKILTTYENFKVNNEVLISRSYVILLNAVVVGYFAWATSFFIKTKNHCESNGCDVEFGGMQWCDGYGMLILLLAIIYLSYLYYVLKRFYGKYINETYLQPLKAKIFARKITRIVFGVVLLVAVVTFIVLDTSDARNRLQSLSGIVTFLIIGYVFSKSPTKVKLRPVALGFTFQFVLGLFCLRWSVGRSIFKCIGDKVSTFLSFTNFGSSFVYGNDLVIEWGVFAFSALPVIFFFSFVTSILFYLGAIQWVLKKMGWLIQSTLGVTACESLVCAANIFVGNAEACLIIKSYIKFLTHSEIHLLMASGFATVAGSVLAAYIRFGAEPAHLIASTVMAAPGAVCFAKLFYPETEGSQTTAENIELQKSTDSNILDAASNGAGTAISIVMGIIANIVAFVAFVAFLNAIVSWLGSLIGYDFLTFEWIFAKIFIPVAWIIGIEWNDCEKVAEVIASKTIINEFVAYERLGVLKGTGQISLRSSAITTFAICGFANPSSLGILIGALSTMSPESRHKITAVAFRAFISGSIICFMTASIAGLLITDADFILGE
ncbi:Solute carrier family 28 member 3 [Pseudolycoriella hygida]|uniref:Solute carrier family 28 member 3 n=1 Tax=Pseudolycoriella hygida TaxID=35572 RepID=A0A9Q0RZW7_9DIPT|nr:Solute carrier family 28 member 3 [Pseudolycoriella hygida]